MYHHATAAPSCLAVPLLPGASNAAVAPLSRPAWYHLVLSLVIVAASGLAALMSRSGHG